MNWQKLISTHLPGAKTQGPATPAVVDSAERALGVALPVSLRDLLSQSNGVLDRHQSRLVWPAESIAEANLSFRRNEEFAELYMPFDCLLFFGESGSGDQFAFPIQAGEIRRPDIFIWEHETDSRSWFAGGLESFFEAVKVSEGS